MKEEYLEYYRRYLDEYGIKSESRICIEEMAELTKELCKYMRYSSSEKQGQNINAIREEIADVLNMAEQLEYYFGEEGIEKIREYKIIRSKIRDS